tara:strand:- start:121 stop:351 length:231 start_codon:yes stop_codon:yes gene_type:complete
MILYYGSCRVSPSNISLGYNVVIRSGTGLFAENSFFVWQWVNISNLFSINDTDVQSKHQGLTLLNGEQYNLEDISL